MAKDLQNSFSFWCPISKAQEQLVDPTTGEQIMRLGGIASTADEDSDGEFLDPKGFDIKPLLNRGVVNWHHQAKGNPGAIIGEPSKAEIRKEGLYIETDLYPSSQVARDVWDLANTLEHDSKNRRLGYSIEGKVLKRKSEDPNDPGYKHIVKAVITGVAITHMPKNPKTFANIIKGEIDEEDYEEEERAEEQEVEKEEEKALDTESGTALKRESVDGYPKILTKSEVMDRLFCDVAGISISKAEQIYNLIKSISVMSKKKNITDEDIVKAYETLGLEMPEEEIQKGKNCGSEDIEKDDDEEQEEETEEREQEQEEQETEEQEEEKPVEKANLNERFDAIEKAINDSRNSSIQYIKALGVMLKDSTNKLEKAQESLELSQSRIDELNELVKAQEETIGELSSRIESFGAGGAVPKSLSHARPVQRTFTKGLETDIEKAQEENPNAISMSKNPRAVAELLDQACFAKGFDEEFSKACTHFEAQHTLPANIIARLKNEFGYEVVK